MDPLVLVRKAEVAPEANPVAQSELIVWMGFEEGCSAKAPVWLASYVCGWGCSAVGGLFFWRGAAYP